MKISGFFAALALALCFTNHCYCQQISLNNLPFTADIRCVYRFTYQSDSLNKMSVVSETAFLFINKQESEYTTRKNLQMDSAQRVVLARMRLNQGGRLSVAGMPVTSINYRIYKNYECKSITTIETIDIQRFRYTEPESVLAWRILPERQAVAGYACQKAQVAYAGRNYEAWFTNELPISDGPYKFSGLPGLIVRLADTKAHYSFDLVAVQKLATPMTVPGFMGNVQETTRARFRQAGQDYRANPFAAMESEGMVVTEEDRSRHRDKLKRRNNPLELR
ncbi:GLPGLI family protein [Hymenobacter sp. DH14]|uniref:GLPGLI family protein n=1 Tax=Hymenobacter cyanobacteriorum TaxID=2926463 RepID=A0A9X2AJL0_9BACT|nr:GLPGLI family protein [Hymenobacter cyanobacteriorum]MCI1188949.1 GLPGLI family protein [Hymenobacter cyanobacteriorum]